MGKLVNYFVEVDTPKGVGEIEVPTFMGPEAAERRAVVMAASVGWGDLDEITARVVEIIPGR